MPVWILAAVSTGVVPNSLDKAALAVKIIAFFLPIIWSLIFLFVFKKDHNLKWKNAFFVFCFAVGVITILAYSILKIGTGFSWEWALMQTLLLAAAFFEAVEVINSLDSQSKKKILFWTILTGHLLLLGLGIWLSAMKSFNLAFWIVFGVFALLAIAVAILMGLILKFQKKEGQEDKEN